MYQSNVALTLLGGIAALAIVLGLGYATRGSFAGLILGVLLAAGLGAVIMYNLKQRNK